LKTLFAGSAVAILPDQEQISDFMVTDIVLAIHKNFQEISTGKKRIADNCFWLYWALGHNVSNRIDLEVG